jgi:hypothetical protein
VAKRTLTITVQATGVRETLAAFNGLPKEASAQLRKAAEDLAQVLATDARASGQREGSQAALVAGTVRPGRDRVPVVQAGGAKRVGSRRAPAWKLLFGAEFGSNRFTQFPRAHQGSAGIWFFPTIEENAATIARRWRQAADDILTAFASKGD